MQRDVDHLLFSRKVSLGTDISLESAKAGIGNAPFVKHESVLLRGHPLFHKECQQNWLYSVQQRAEEVNVRSLSWKCSPDEAMILIKLSQELEET